MRVLCPIVEAVANLVPIGCADVILRSRIGSKRVGDDQPRAAVSLYDPLEELQRGSLVPLCDDHCLQDLPFWATIPAASCLEAPAAKFRFQSCSWCRVPLARASGLMSIECVDPDRIGPSSPPWSVNGNDAERFEWRRVAPGPLSYFREFNRRLREPASDTAHRRRCASVKREGVDRRAFDPHLVAGEVNVVNARALGGIELSSL